MEFGEALVRAPSQNPGSAGAFRRLISKTTGRAQLHEIWTIFLPRLLREGEHDRGSLAAMSEPSQWRSTADCRTGRRCSTARPIRFPGPRSRPVVANGPRSMQRRLVRVGVSACCPTDPPSMGDLRRPPPASSRASSCPSAPTVSRTGRCRGSDGRVVTGAARSSPDQEPPRGGSLHDLSAAADEKDISAAMISAFNAA
jgi:hypothetical protein